MTTTEAKAVGKARELYEQAFLSMVGHNTSRGIWIALPEFDESSGLVLCDSKDCQRCPKIKQARRILEKLIGPF